MKIAFWNMQRLGQDSAKREEAIRNLLNTQRPNFLFLCELTSTHPNGQINSSNPYALRYACLDSAGHPVNLTFAKPIATDTWKEAQYKGGGNFDNLAPRGLAYIQITDTGTNEQLHLYMLHGPASNNAVKVASYVGCYLNEHHGDDPWLLLGDLNVEPQKLANSPVGIDMSDLIVAPSIATHKGGKILDYALTNMPDEVEISTVRRSQRTTGSDHSPIIAQWG